MTSLFDLNPKAAGAAESAQDTPQDGAERANPGLTGVSLPETPETAGMDALAQDVAIPDAEEESRPRCRDSGAGIGIGGWCRHCSLTLPADGPRQVLQIPCSAV